MNILFVRLSYIGDILHATPAARWIKEQYPDAKLHWIVTPSMVDLLKGNPYVDEIIPWERDVYEAHSKKLHIPTMWRMWWALKAKLKPYHFDVAVDVQGRLISGLVLLASGAPIRLGLGGTKELNWLFTNYKAKSSKAHVIRRYMDVVQLLPRALADKGIELLKENGADDKDVIDANALYAMNFRVSPESKKWAESIWSSFDGTDEAGDGDVSDTRFNSGILRICLVLGTSWTSKEWPQEKWYSLVESLRYRANFICLGGEKEAEQYALFIESIRTTDMKYIVQNMMGHTSLEELGAIIAQSDVVVSADTGALHMALALGKPAVALFGPTNPNIWGPLTGHYRVLVNDTLDCLGCRRRRCPKPAQYCMSGIDSIRVKKAIMELIGEVKYGKD